MPLLHRTNAAGDGLLSNSEASWRVVLREPFPTSAISMALQIKGARQRTCLNSLPAASTVASLTICGAVAANEMHVSAQNRACFSLCPPDLEDGADHHGEDHYRRRLEPVGHQSKPGWLRAEALVLSLPRMYRVARQVIRKAALVT